MDMISHGRDRPPLRRRPVARRLLIPTIVLAAAVAAVVLVETSRSPTRTAKRPVLPPPPPTAAAPLAVSSAAAAADQVSALLRRPTHFPVLRPGQRCPASPGRSTDVPGGGIALGDGPVRPIIGNSGDLRRGLADLATTDQSGWYALDVIWLSSTGYQGPFTIRAQRLGSARPGAVTPAGEPQAGEPLTTRLVVTPAGTGADNAVDGHTEEPVATWIRSPGCYAWQIDGIGFSHITVINARASAFSTQPGRPASSPRPNLRTGSAAPAHEKPAIHAARGPSAVDVSLPRP